MKWTRKEILLALRLYLETPFGQQHSSHPPIIELAKLIGRTPGAVAMKLSNLTSMDPVELERGIKGLSGASKLDKQIWAEYQANPTDIILEAESLDPASGEAGPTSEPDPTEKWTKNKVRLGQKFFRRGVLASYGARCCISGNPIKAVLRAGHILPWSVSTEHRLNLRNGICFEATYDAAFDAGIISIDFDYKIKVSPEISNYSGDPEVVGRFLNLGGRLINLPLKNIPAREFLKWHQRNIYISA